MPTQSFDWDGLDEDDIVVKPQNAVAVYLNPNDDLVIRQQDAMIAGEDDAIIVVPLDHLDRLLDRLIQIRNATRGPKQVSIARQDDGVEETDF